MDDPYSSPQTSPSNNLPQMPPVRSTWPTVLGVIAVVFGVLGAIGGLLGLLAPIMYHAMGSEAMASGGMTPDFMEKWGVYLVINPLVISAIALILLVGGILLLRRKPKSVNMLRFWSILKIVYAVVASVFGFAMQKDQFPAVMSNLPETAENAEAMETFGTVMNIFGPVGIALGFLWAVALPVFLLIWFARQPVKAEVAGWE